MMSEPSPVKVIVYATQWCPFCIRAIGLLKKKQANFDVIDVDKEPRKRAEMVEKSGRTSVPQIWIAEEHIGGCDDLMLLERSGNLNAKLGLE